MENGQWVEASTEIQITPTGAIAAHGQHQVTFAANINTAGAIDLTTPEGKHLRGHILGLSYFDAATGTNVLIAELKDSVGQLLPTKNQVLYADAFTDFQADVRYTYTKAGFEQDIILRQQIPSPAEWGLNPATTRLDVLTEFIDPPVPGVTRRQMPGGPDQQLDFGVMQMGQGRAFMVGTASEEVPVNKQWSNFDGRTVLVEEVPVSQIQPQLDTLPPAPAATTAQLHTSPDSVLHRLALQRLLPEPKFAVKGTSGFKLAALSTDTKGLVLDYTVATSQSNFTFQSDSTYFVSGTLNLSGTTTIEGNTVVKYANTNLAELSISGTLNCQTAPYRPAVFTAKDDNSVGEIISGSTGTPSGYYAFTALWCSGISPGADLNYVRILNASTGVRVIGTAVTSLRNSQFVHCDTSVFALSSATLNVRNTLLYQSGTYALRALFGSTALCEHLTVDQASTLIGGSSSTVFLTNSLLAAITNWGIFTGGNNATNADSSIFQTVGAASHYLADNSPYRNAGTTNLSTDMLAILPQTTTYPPLVYSNATIAADTTFNPQAQRDTDAPDLGYHYDPLDYVFGGTDANANLTFTKGTAAGWFRTSSGWFHAGHGIHLGDTKIASFTGQVDAPAYWVRTGTVQEGGTAIWGGGYGPGGISGWANQNAGNDSQSPEVHAQFTLCSMLASDGNFFRDDWGYLKVRAAHCEFWSGGMGGYAIGMYLTNCLMMRMPGSQVEGHAGNEVYVRDCTWRGADFSLARSLAIPVSIKDSAFEGTVFNASDAYKNNTNYTTYDYNAFLSGANRTDPTGAHDVIVTNSFGWQTGPLGNYYLPTNSTLIDAGSLTNAGLAGLFHFTTTTDQVKDGATRLDIGYHYLALTNGVPIDTDGDGVPDYAEDANGNGTVNSGETSWTDPADLGLRVFITRPKNNSIIP
ncbi:MAG: hypothetical protein JWR19_1182 [Pedosphaera sp.]|nr:hypothetical protein [Pedosphaera sp.]